MLEDSGTGVMRGKDAVGFGDLAAAADGAHPLPGPRCDNDVLQAASLPPSAFPVQFHNASGVPVVLAVERDAATLPAHWALLFSGVQRDVSGEADDAAAWTTGGSRDGATALDGLLAAASSFVVCGGQAACIALPPGASVGWTSARSRHALGVVTTRHSAATAAMIAGTAGTPGSTRESSRSGVDDAAAVATTAFPPLRVFLGYSGDAVARVLGSALAEPPPGPINLRVRMRPSDAVPAPLQLCIAAAGLGRRSVTIRGCTVIHNATGVALELWVGPVAGSTGVGPSVSARVGTAAAGELLRVGVVAARSSLALPVHLPPLSAAAALRLRPLPLGTASVDAAAAYGLSGALPLLALAEGGRAVDAFELECRATSTVDSALPPFFLAVQVARAPASASAAASAAPLAAVLVHCPLLLTNALPVQLDMDVAGVFAERLAGAPHVAVLSPGVSLEVYASSGGRGAGRLVLPSGHVVGSASKAEPALRIRVRGTRKPAEWLPLTAALLLQADRREGSSGGPPHPPLPPPVLAVDLAAEDAGLASPPAQAPSPLSVLVEVQRTDPWGGGAASGQALAPAAFLQQQDTAARDGGWVFSSSATASPRAAARGPLPGPPPPGTGRLDVVVFVPAFLANHSGLPLLLGEARLGRQAGGDAIDDDAAGDDGSDPGDGGGGSGWGNDGEDWGGAGDGGAALPLAAALGAAGGVVASACQLDSPAVCDEVFEHMRFDHVAGWRPAWLFGDPPYWADASGAVPLTREDVSSRLPRGWTWAGAWAPGPWDHSARFRNFRTPSHRFHGERRARDTVRRRRWTRLRVRSGAAQPSAVQPAASPLEALWGEAYSPPAAAAAVALLSARAPPLAESESAAEEEASFGGGQPPLPVAFARVLAGEWGAAIDVGALLPTSSSGGGGGVLFLHGSAVSGGGGDLSPLARSAVAAARAPDCPLALPAGRRPRFDLAVDAARLPPPFARSVAVSLRPALTLVNATGGPLSWRQAAGRGSSLPEHTIGPGTTAPMWLCEAPAGMPAASAPPPRVQFSPAAACGAWSPPVDLTLPVLLPGGASGGSEARRVPVVIAAPLPGEPPFVRSLQHAGAAGGGGSGSGGGSLGRTPLRALVIGVTVRRDPAAPAGSAALLAVVSLQTPPATPLRPPPSVVSGSAKERELVARAWAGDLDRAAPAAAGAAPASAGAATAAHPPFITLVNHSRFVVAWRQRGARAFTAQGDPYLPGAARDAEAQLGGLLALPPAPGATLTAPGDDTLGIALAGATFFAPPHSVSAVGLVDPETGAAAAAAAAAIQQPRRGGATAARSDFDPNPAAGAGGGGEAGGAAASDDPEVRARLARAREELILALVDPADGPVAGRPGLLRLPRMGRCLVLWAAGSPQPPPAAQQQQRQHQHLPPPLPGRLRVGPPPQQQGGAGARAVASTWDVDSGAPASVPAAAVVRVVMRGLERRIIVHDAGSLGPDLLRLLAAAAPHPSSGKGTGGAAAAEDFELLPEAVALAAEALLPRGSGGDTPPLLPPTLIFEAAGAALAAADAAPWPEDVRVAPSATAADDAGSDDRAGLSAAHAPVAFSLRRPLASLPPALAWASLVRLRVAAVGLSLVHDAADPREVAYLRAGAVVAAVAQTPTTNACSLRVGRLALDDPSYDAELPAVLGRAGPGAAAAATAEPQPGEAGGAPSTSATPASAPVPPPLLLPQLLAEVDTARDASLLASLATAGSVRDRGVRVLRASLDIQPLRVCVSARWVVGMIRVARSWAAAVSARQATEGSGSASAAGPASSDLAVLSLAALTPTRPRDAAAAAATLEGLLARAQRRCRPPPPPGLLHPADTAAAASTGLGLWLAREVVSDGGGGGGPLDALLYIQSLRVGALVAIVDVRLEPDADLSALLPPLLARLAGAVSVPVRGARLGFAFAPVQQQVRTAAALGRALLAALAPQARRQWVRILEAMGGVGAPIALARAVASWGGGSGPTSGGGGAAAHGRSSGGGVAGATSTFLGGVGGLAGLASGALGAASAAGTNREAAADASLGFRVASSDMAGGPPDSFAGGAAAAAEQIVGGLLGGVAGLFTKTAHGLRSGTLGGALQGAAAGVAGVLLTPLAGATGAAASLLAGAEQQLRSDDAKAGDAGRLRRSRAPRVFLGHAGAVAVYSADVAARLASIQTQAARAELAARRRRTDAAMRTRELAAAVAAADPRLGSGAAARLLLQDAPAGGAATDARPASAPPPPPPGTVERLLRLERLLDGSALVITSRRVVHVEAPASSTPSSGTLGADGAGSAPAMIPGGHAAGAIIWAAPMQHVRCAVDAGSPYRLLLTHAGVDVGTHAFAFADATIAPAAAASIRRAAAALHVCEEILSALQLQVDLGRRLGRREWRVHLLLCILGRTLLACIALAEFGQESLPRLLRQGWVLRQLALDHERLDVVDRVHVVHRLLHHLAHRFEALEAAHGRHRVALHLRRKRRGWCQGLILNDAVRVASARACRLPKPALPRGTRQDVAPSQQLQRLQRGAVWPQQPLPPLHEAVLGAHHAADLDDVTLHVVLQNAQRLQGQKQLDKMGS